MFDYSREKEVTPVIRLTKETWQLLRLNFRNLLLFEIIYRMITVPLYLYLVGQACKQALRMAGYSYVTVGNLFTFLVKPGTILMLFLLLIVFLLFFLVEIGGLLTVFQGAAYHRQVSLFSILLGGCTKVLDEIKKKNWKLFFTVLIHGTLIQAFFLFRLLLHVKPVSFILPELKKLPGIGGITIGLTLILIVFSLATTFVCYGCMVEQRSFPGAVNRSQQLMQGHWGQVFLLFACVNLAVAAGCILFYWSCTLITAVLAVKLVETSRQMAVLLRAGDRIELAFIFLGSVAAMVTHYGLLTVFYYQYGSRLERHQPWDFSMGDKRWMNRRRFVGILVVVTACSFLILSDSIRSGFATENELLYETRITAHRGSSRRAPENTLAALEAAIEDLADYAEIDVQETADGVLVLFHDGSLKRIGNKSGSVSSMTYEQLCEIDAGSWFSPEFAGEPIPTLQQAMELCRGRLNLNIEMKYSSVQKQLPAKLAKLITEQGFEQQCVVTSTAISDLRKVKEQNPEIKTGYILTAAYGAYYTEEAIDFISIRAGNLTESLLHTAHQNGKAVHVWTVNKKSELERMKKLGVDNIITDDPLLAREILYQTEQAVSLLSSIRLMLEQ